MLGYNRKEWGEGCPDNPIYDIQHYEHKGYFNDHGEKIIINTDEAFECFDPLYGEHCKYYQGIRGDGSPCEYAKHITAKISWICNDMTFDLYICEHVV